MIEKLVELQKALDQWETQVNAMTLSWGSIQVQQANFHYFKELFSAFQKDYDSKVPVDLQKEAKTLPETDDPLLRDLVEHFAKRSNVKLGKWVSLDVVQQFLMNQRKQLKQVKEKNVEYAKLVAGQAQEYAERLKGKILVDRKQVEIKRDKYQKRLDILASEGKWTHESVALSSAINELNGVLKQVFAEDFAAEEKK